MNRVMVVGVGGVGHVVASVLNSDRVVDEILAVDVSEKNLRHLQERIGGEKLSLHVMDARDVERLSRLMVDVSVVVNSAHFMLNQTLIDASLRAECNFISLTGGEELWIEGGSRYREMLERHRRMDLEWRDKRLLGILGLGEDPGLSNIFARYLVEQIEEVDEVAIRDADTVLDDRYVIAPLWSREELLLSSIAPAVYYEDGEFKRAEPLSVCTSHVFPQPVGQKKIYLKEHPEVWTLSEFLPKRARKITFWYNYDGNSAEVIRAMHKLGLLSRKKIRVGGVEVSPFDVVVEILPQPIEMAEVAGYAGIEVEVTGKIGRKMVSKKIFTFISHTEAYRMFGVNGTSYLVGLPAAIGASLIVRGELNERGLLFPEQLDPAPFMKKLQEHGLPLIFEERTIEELRGSGEM